MSDWMKKFTNVEDKLDVEAFEKSKPVATVNIDVIPFNGALINGKRARGASRKPYPLRLDESLTEGVDLASASISKNDALNSLIEFALAELKRQGKTIVNK